jgi:hypothetical protein
MASAVANIKVEIDLAIHMVLKKIPERISTARQYVRKLEYSTSSAFFLASESNPEIQINLLSDIRQNLIPYTFALCMNATIFDSSPIAFELL